MTCRDLHLQVKIAMRRDDTLIEWSGNFKTTPSLDYCSIRNFNLWVNLNYNVLFECMCPYKLPTPQHWKKTPVLVMDLFLDERAGLAAKGYAKTAYFLIVLVHSFGPLGAKSLLFSDYPPNGFCRLPPHSTAQRQWCCCGLRTEHFWTMRPSTFGRRDEIYPGICRLWLHSTS